jgi:protein phosphatase
VWTDRASDWTARVGAVSHVGNYREHNDDFVVLDRRHPFALVLDGMGGHLAGELASRKGAEAVQRALRGGLNSGAEPRGLIEPAFRAGHEQIAALSALDCDFRNCGTTIVMALLHGGRVYVSWLGDSAAFLVSGTGTQRLTWTHDLRTFMIRKGMVSEGDAFWKNVLLFYLGGSWPEGERQLEILSHTPQPGDRLVLTTDGVSNVLTHSDLLDVCRSHSEPLTCAKELVNLALDRGSRDNCTCAVIAFERFGGDRPAAPQPLQPRKWWTFWK